MLTFFPSQAGRVLIMGLSSDTKPSPSVGMTFLEEDTGKIWRVVTNTWVCTSDLTYQLNGGSGGTYSRVGITNSLTTGQSLVDISGLSNALLANSVYEFEAVLSVQTSGDTNGVGYGVNFTGTVSSLEAHITGSLTNIASKTLRINNNNTSAQPFLTTASQVGGILIRGIIATGPTGGNLSIRHLKITSGVSTVFNNSFLRTTKIA